MMIAGLQLIVLSGPVPESLKFGRTCAIVTPREARDLAQFKTEAITALLNGHDKFMTSLNL